MPRFTPPAPDTHRALVPGFTLTAPMYTQGTSARVHIHRPDTQRTLVSWVTLIAPDTDRALVPGFTLAALDG